MKKIDLVYGEIRVWRNAMLKEWTQDNFLSTSREKEAREIKMKNKTNNTSFKSFSFIFLLYSLRAQPNMVKWGNELLLCLAHSLV
jgi:hypothetical protein